MSAFQKQTIPFTVNNKLTLHVLDRVHCDLWGQKPVPSKEVYLYYFIFVDDFSHFTWFYPLRLKSDFL